MDAQMRDQGPREASNTLVPVDPSAGSGRTVGAADNNIRNAMEDSYRREANDMKQSLRDMQERIEAHSAQLRDAVKSLNDIVTTQNTQAANHTSMGLLLANTAAGQTAQERSIREELSEIKEMIQNRLGGERKELSLDLVQDQAVVALRFRGNQRRGNQRQLLARPPHPPRPKRTTTTLVIAAPQSH